MTVMKFYYVTLVNAVRVSNYMYMILEVTVMDAGSLRWTSDMDL